MLERLELSSPDELILLLQSKNRALAAAACIALGRTGRKIHAPLLLSVLSGKRRSLWRPAARGLSMLESKRALQALIRLLLDRSRPAGQRTAAAYALAFTWSGLADPRYAGPIGEAIASVMVDSSASPSLRGQVAEGCAYLYGPCAGGTPPDRLIYERAGQILIAALGDSSAEVRFWSAFALGSMRCRAGLPALRKLARTDKAYFGSWWTVGEEASDAVRRINGKPVPFRVVLSAEQATARLASE
jgi:HEAT repeat protein